MKFKVGITILLIGLVSSSCSVISPLVINYNGVRGDVATTINHNMRLSLSDRKVLVEYAKEQQKILNSAYQNDSAQHELAEQRAIGRYCSLQKVSQRKLDWVDQKIFALEEQQEKFKYMQSLQQQVELNPTLIDCSDTF